MPCPTPHARSASSCHPRPTLCLPSACPPCSALAADPSNLNVLLSLGVSHTNELEAGQALAYLQQWVTAHPKHAAATAAVPPQEDSSQAARHVVRGWEVGRGSLHAPAATTAAALCKRLQTTPHSFLGPTRCPTGGAV